MAEVVVNPETGNPAVAETVYRDLELDAEQAKHTELENELAELTAQHDELSAAKAAKESQLADQKSLVDGINAVAPAQPEPVVEPEVAESVESDEADDEGTAGDGSEAETEDEDSSLVL